MCIRDSPNDTRAVIARLAQLRAEKASLPVSYTHLDVYKRQLLPYGLGRAGGELFLLKRVDRARFERLRDRFERQEFLAVMIPSMMPPPTPWKMFVFASGVFEMRVPDFLLAVFAGRMVRWLALSLLVLKFGPGVVDLVAQHARVTVLIAGALAVLGFAWWWIRKKRQGKLLAD